MSQAPSTPDSPREVFLPKQSANIYTMMFILAFLAIVIGCLFLYLEMKTYDTSIKVSPDAKVLPPSERNPSGSDNFHLTTPIARWSPFTAAGFNPTI